jgi:DNA polymerase III sliding clamp (beta) subunit (PCNA family)
MTPTKLISRCVRKARDFKSPIGVELLPDWVVIRASNGDLWYQASIRWKYGKLEPRSFSLDAKTLLARLKHGRIQELRGDPDRTPIKPSDQITLPATIPIQVLAQVRPAMCRDSGRHLEGVHVEIDDQGVQIVTTDGHKLIQTTVPTERQAGPVGSLDPKLVDLAVKHLSGDIKIETGAEVCSVRSSTPDLIEEFAARTPARPMDFPPWRSIWPAMIHGGCTADRERLADAAWRVAATHDLDHVRLQVGEPLEVFDRGPDHEVVYRVASKDITGPEAAIQVNGVFLYEMLDAIDCKEVEILLGKDASTSAEKSLASAKELGVAWLILKAKEQIEKHKARPPIVLELRAPGYRAAIMGIRQ